MERTQLASSRMEEQNEKQPKDETEGNRVNKRPGNLRKKVEERSFERGSKNIKGRITSLKKSSGLRMLIFQDQSLNL